MKRFLLMISCLCFSFAAEAKLQGGPAPDFSIMKDGELVSIADVKDKVVILEWVTEGCPFLHHYRGDNGFDQGKMPGLEKATDSDIIWVSIVDSHGDRKTLEQDTKLEEERASKGFASTSVTVDKNGRMTRLFGDKGQHPYITIIKNGKVTYQGHIQVVPRENGNYCLIDDFAP